MCFIFCRAISRGPSALALDFWISRPDVWHLFRRTDCNMESIGLELVVRQFPYSSALMTDHSGFWLVLGAAWFWSGGSHVPHRKLKQEVSSPVVTKFCDVVTESLLKSQPAIYFFRYSGKSVRQTPYNTSILTKAK